VGCAVPAHAADMAKYDGKYICGNTGLSVVLAHSDQPQRVGKYIVREQMVNVVDEGQNLLFSDSTFVADSVPDSDIQRYGMNFLSDPSTAKGLVIYPTAQNEITVYRTVLNKRGQIVAGSTQMDLICSK
ncbi:hypothetical protein, partial [Herbiconiux daphne]